MKRKTYHYEDLNLNDYTDIPSVPDYYTHIGYDEISDMYETAVEIPKKSVESVKVKLNPEWMIKNAIIFKKGMSIDRYSPLGYNNYMEFFYTDDQWFYVNLTGKAYFKCDQLEGFIKFLEDIHLVEIVDEERSKKIESSKKELLSKVERVIKKFSTFKEIENFKINNRIYQI
jgi:hypothetical protein